MGLALVFWFQLKLPESLEISMSEIRDYEFITYKNNLICWFFSVEMIRMYFLSDNVKI